MKHKIKIISGWTMPGGSTIAFINLCNALNAAGHDCTFYGPHSWHLDKCKAEDVKSCAPPTKNEIVIAHYLNLDFRPDAKRVILSCHEKDVYPIQRKFYFWDSIAYVSEKQMLWQGVPGKVIPNIISDIKRVRTIRTAAGVIGSIDRNKNTHASIREAFAKGYPVVLLFGNITDWIYFDAKVKPYVDSGQARLMGHEDDKSKMYSMLDAVFHFSLSETFNFIKPECDLAGVKYFGSSKADSGSKYYATKADIVKLWEEEFDA